MAQLVLLTALFALIQFEPSAQIEMSCVLGARSGYLRIIIMTATYLSWIHLFFDSLNEVIGFILFILVALGGTIYWTGHPPLFADGE
mmetsp:Transcript_3816/g.5776  ORF Transcript_3816/g.5776 Transcript_3816/m.5776 type:complete len:87 (-) Transcript_3816:4155-4415(-)